jgi:hypothetical protein
MFREATPVSPERSCTRTLRVVAGMSADELSFRDGNNAIASSVMGSETQRVVPKNLSIQIVSASHQRGDVSGSIDVQGRSL